MWNEMPIKNLLYISHISLPEGPNYSFKRFLRNLFYEFQRNLFYEGQSLQKVIRRSCKVKAGTYPRQVADHQENVISTSFLPHTSRCN